jgi:CRP-like cAMP-binding protein
MPGEFLLHEGHIASGVFILSGGTVQVFLRHGVLGGKHFNIYSCSSPAILGLPATVLGGCFVAAAQAVTEVQTVFIPRTAFTEVVREFPAANLAFSTVLSDELNSIYHHLSELRSARPNPAAERTFVNSWYRESKTNETSHSPTTQFDSPVDLVAEENVETRDVNLKISILRTCVTKPEVFGVTRRSF